MSIQEEIDRLSAAKASIAASLQAMGIEPPEGTTLEQYAAQLAAIATAAPWLSIPGGGTMQMGESLGDGPYTIEVTEDGEGGGLSAEQVGYSNTGSGLEATNVQGAIDELAGKGGGEYLPLTGGTMTGPLTLSGLPTSKNHAANKQYVDTSVEQALGSIGYSLIKEYTSPGSFTHTFDRKYTDVLWLWLALAAAAVRMESAVEVAAEVGPQRASMFWIAVPSKAIVLLLELVEPGEVFLWGKVIIIKAPMVGVVALLVLPYQAAAGALVMSIALQAAMVAVMMEITIRFPLAGS